MSLAVRSDPDGATFEVRVMPRAQPEGIGGVRDGRLIVRVGSAPVEGQANRALLRIVAKALGVARSAVSIAAGERSRTKRLVVSGVTPARVRASLRQE